MTRKKKPHEDDQPLHADRYLSADTWKGDYLEGLEKQCFERQQYSREAVLGYDLFRQAVKASASYNERTLWQHACEALDEAGNHTYTFLRFVAKPYKDIDDFLKSGDVLIWAVNFKEPTQKAIKMLEIKNLGYFADELQRILNAFDLGGIEQFAKERLKIRGSGIALNL